MSLNVVQRIKHNHTRRNRHGVVHRLAAVLVSSKYVQDRFGHRSALLDETFNGSPVLSLGTKDILPAVSPEFAQGARRAPNAAELISAPRVSRSRMRGASRRPSAAEFPR